MIKRIFWLIADSFGIGNAPDAEAFGDAGANTLRTCMNSGQLSTPTMASLGLFHIAGVSDCVPKIRPIGCYGRMEEKSAGKDTTIGHWELCGIRSDAPLPTYPNGFPSDVIDRLKAAFGRDILCNRPYSGTEVIRDYGAKHVDTGALIVYTSADSVLQIAAHEDIVPIDELYRYCELARNIMSGEHGVGRVIARPFVGDRKHGFQRTSRRHDYSLKPPAPTVLDALTANGMDTIGVGKIHDIFAGQGIQRTIRTTDNADGLRQTQSLLADDFHGLCFVNLVDFDMIYGHRRDIAGYTRALNEMDAALDTIISQLRPSDVLILTADHGCDPGFKGTDHTRETVPLLIYGPTLPHGVDLGVRHSFSDVGATIAQLLGVSVDIQGVSFAKELTV